MAPSESTPLLTVVRVRQPHPRYTHSTVRRFCTVALGSSIAFVFLCFLFPILLIAPHRHALLGSSPPRYWPMTSLGTPYQEFVHDLSTIPNTEHLQEWSRYYASGPHLAGKNYSQAVWTKDLWESWGIKSEIIAYDTYINYPEDHRLALIDHGSVVFEASLEEDVLPEDPTSGLVDRIPTFHGYSASGNVTAQYIFANYGSFEDFEDLVKAGIKIKGTIVVVKYGRVFRGLKVKRAEELGAVGVLIYSDPGDDGEITEVNGYKPYPFGPARNPSSVQRGSVQYIGNQPGDPTTPGYPSKPGVPRGPANASTPSIPSLPISYKDALPILKALNGRGPNATSLGGRWSSGGLGHFDIHYSIGPSYEKTVLNLYNAQEYTITPLWDVIGVINGTIPDEVVILGNHRDAWLAGGAGDPNSGSAALNEVARSFGAALQKGWKPLRTTVLASWDGEEYALIGSTEFVEEFMPWLKDSAVAYLNVDVGTAGPRFGAGASPILNHLIRESTKAVQSPNQTLAGQTLADLWNGKIPTLGSGSDFTAFLDFAGVSSVDMGFHGSLEDPVYHYHSNYDSTAWMEKYGDKGYLYHLAVTQLWTIMATSLIEDPVIPFNVTDYALALASYVEKLQAQASTAGMLSEPSLNFTSLFVAIDSLQQAAIIHDAQATALRSALNYASSSWWLWWQTAELWRTARRLNTAYKRFENAFLWHEGLKGRPLFKHTLFAPDLWNGYAGVTLPGISEAIVEGNYETAQHWIGVVAERVAAAQMLLEV